MGSWCRWFEALLTWASSSCCICMLSCKSWSITGSCSCSSTRSSLSVLRPCESLICWATLTGCRSWPNPIFLFSLLCCDIIYESWFGLFCVRGWTRWIWEICGTEISEITDCLSLPISSTEGFSSWIYKELKLRFILSYYYCYLICAEFPKFARLLWLCTSLRADCYYCYYWAAAIRCLIIWPVYRSIWEWFGKFRLLILIWLIGLS